MTFSGPTLAKGIILHLDHDGINAERNLRQNPRISLRPHIAVYLTFLLLTLASNLVDVSAFRRALVATSTCCKGISLLRVRSVNNQRALPPRIYFIQMHLCLNIYTTKCIRIKTRTFKFKTFNCLLYYTVHCIPFPRVLRPW